MIKEGKLPYALFFGSGLLLGFCALALTVPCTGKAASYGFKAFWENRHENLN